jgi:hypothetical protein
MVGTMKRVHLTQTYELTMTVGVDTPDDYSDEDIVNALTDFPVNATVESMWDEVSDLVVRSLCVDSLISLNGSGTTVITDDDGNIIAESA